MDNSFELLNDFQKEVFKDIVKLDSCSISLPVGSGKTLLSIVVALHQSNDYEKILFVCSKTLVENAVNDIKKFFGDTLPFKILHKDYIKNIETFTITNEKIIITTIDVVSKYYKNLDIQRFLIDKRIINQGRFGQHELIYYNTPTKSYINQNLSGPGLLYSTNWGSLIIDEVQNFTNIETGKCQGLASIYSKTRYALSGTLFNEPKPEKMLGYFTMMHNPNFPKNLPETIKHLRNGFKGYNKYIVHRDTNPSYTEPIINEVIINHQMNANEETLYIILKDTLKVIAKYARQYKNEGNIDLFRKFNSYKLAMLIYLRQSLVCPILPIAKAMLDSIDLKNRSRITRIINDKIQESGLSDFLDSTDAINSSRIKEMNTVLEKHEDEKVLIFTTFRTCLQVVASFVKGPVFTLTSNMSSAKRQSTLELFKASSNGRLLLTYDIGSEGLNLQEANNVLLLDFFWNCGKTKQAIGRVLRYGQQANVVNIYHFTSNTGIEQAIFTKQKEKMTILNELSTGTQVSAVKTININDVIRFLEDYDTNASLMRDVKRLGTHRRV